MDKEFLKDLLSVPSCSRFEVRMIEYIMKFASENDIEFSVKNNNVYLTKGTVKIDEYFPCFTAHLDTVHHRQIPYVISDTRIPIEESTTSNGDIAFSSPKIGIGGDDKCGIAIILELMKHTPICKAAFFWGEEIGGIGSNRCADLPFFSNVGWICGFDSPEYNRAAISCKGNRLFSREFFKKYLKNNLKSYGIDNWRHEPGTDVMFLREKIDVQMMNFGSGYYKMHTEDEYVVYEEVANAVFIGLELINTLGLKKYQYEPKKPVFSYLKWALKRTIKQWYKENF